MKYQLSEATKSAIAKIHASSNPLQQLLNETLGGDSDTARYTTTTAKQDRPFKPIQRLPNNVKRFIVICNASGQKPLEVTWAVKENFGLDISSTHVERYDPTKVSGQTLRQEFKELYMQVKRDREAALLKIGVAHQGTRLTMLHDMCMKALERGDYRLAAAILANVAREVGGQYLKTPKFPDEPEKRRELAALLLDCHPDDIPVIPPRPQPNPPENGGA